MKKNRKFLMAVFLGIPIALLLAVVIIFLVIRMEGQAPDMKLDMTSSYLGSSQTLSLEVSDAKSGIRQIWVAVFKNGKEFVLADKSYTAGGFIKGGQVKAQILKIEFDAKTSGLTDGKAMLRIRAMDYSWRQWGKGNTRYLEKEVLIDTRAPDIQILSRIHNLNQGGAALVAYKLSETCPSSGVMVGDQFYPGISGFFNDDNSFMTFIALNHNQGPKTTVHVMALDHAGNKGRASVAHHINARNFKRDTIKIYDRFLAAKMPEFQSEFAGSAELSGLDLFLKVNRDLRKKNYETIKQIVAEPDNDLHWKGVFARLPKSANRAGFAEHRTYTFRNKTIDEQTHLGVDLASLKKSPVPAANTGKVVFADSLGIYGRTVLIDHGFGLFSMYSHLSKIDVDKGQMVKKYDVIGNTGRSGLAGGDHLHFSMLVHHTFVNPLEWWDLQWINNNIAATIESVR
ncbi:MAG: M23 family metallopeptidase [Desulfobacteraceae bacterium]|nr:M23 family metallopeptidase [Desulfobacteraceae bacterium]